MIRINLIPPEYEQQQIKKERNILFGSAGVVVVGGLLLWWGSLNHKAGELKDKIETQETELKRFQTIVAQMDSINAEKTKLTQKRDVIKNLTKSRLAYPVLFEDFLPIVPADVWITRFQVADSGSTMTLTLNSKALSNFALATWLTNLQQSPHFSGVMLGSIGYGKSSVSADLTVLSFQLTMNYRHQGPMPLSG